MELNPKKRITTIEDVPLWYGLVKAVACAITGAMAVAATTVAINRAFNMEEITVKFIDNDPDPDPESV